jgi:hypothetical protein
MEAMPGDLEQEGFEGYATLFCSCDRSRRSQLRVGGSCTVSHEGRLTLSFPCTGLCFALPGGLPRQGMTPRRFDISHGAMLIRVTLVYVEALDAFQGRGAAPPTEEGEGGEELMWSFVFFRHDNPLAKLSCL